MLITKLLSSILFPDVIGHSVNVIIRCFVPDIIRALSWHQVILLSDLVPTGYDNPENRLPLNRRRLPFGYR